MVYVSAGPWYKSHIAITVWHSNDSSLENLTLRARAFSIVQVSGSSFPCTLTIWASCKFASDQVLVGVCVFVHTFLFVPGALAASPSVVVQLETPPGPQTIL